MNKLENGTIEYQATACLDKIRQESAVTVQVSCKAAEAVAIDRRVKDQTQEVGSYKVVVVFKAQLDS